MLVGDDAIRENIQHSPFTEQVTTTPQKGLSQRAEGVSFIVGRGTYRGGGSPRG